ncbi:hypothetical protein F4814DRAFT_455530 [Daldinia grandis]|nr:hypothetical protein F4814DRAFT_455530 [Daldinia grandis]
MESSLAQLGVQYMPSTGGCMVDLAAIPSHLFNSCSAVHIRIPEAQHHVEVNSNMICINPSQPAPAPAPAPAPGPGAALYREQYIYPNIVVPTDLPHASPKNHKQQPSPSSAPETPVHHPVSESGGVKPVSTDVPNSPHKDSAPTLRTFVQTASWSTLTTAHVALPSSQATHVIQSPAVTTTSCTTHHLHTPGPPTATTTTTRIVHAPTPSTLTTRTLLPSPPSQGPSASTSPPTRPAVIPPPFPLPAPEPIPEANPSSAPQPDPELTTPAYCSSAYYKMDVTRIETLDPHDLASYLDLLGLGDLGLGLDLDLDLEHGIAGLVASLLGGAVDDDATRGVWRELERSYRVECGVSVQEMWSSSSSSWSSGSSRWSGEQVEFVRSMGSQTDCVQECEKSAIGAARDGTVVECLGAAWSARLERDNCRFWTGGRDEFLPVGRVRGGEGGEWDLVYL